MSDYGSPGPQGPYGQSPQSSSAPSSTSESSDASSGDTAQWVKYTNYAAAGLGALAFIWGFLDWLSASSGGFSASESGYATTGPAVVGLSLAAGLIAVAAVLEKKDVTLVPAALAASALLVAVGELISHGDGESASVGLYLALITTILQTAALVYGWMLTSGRMSAPARSPKPQQNPWAGQQSGGPQGGYGGYPQAPGQYGGGQYQPPPAPSYPAPGQYGPPPSPPGQQGAPQFGGQYGPPPSPPVYGAPSGLGPSGPPPQPPAPPSPPAQPPQDESGSGYGEATRHIPRYSPPEQDGQDGSSSS